MIQHSTTQHSCSMRVLCSKVGCLQQAHARSSTARMGGGGEIRQHSMAQHSCWMRLYAAKWAACSKLHSWGYHKPAG
jgi:hypothetical protein